MGEKLLDQYSLLHFAVGVVLYFWNIPFIWALAAHVAFEWLENTKKGMQLINNVSGWPGGKPKADSFDNIVGDNLSFAVGYGAAKSLDMYGTLQGWYDPHLA